ncbi:MAG TPA: D-alanine--D-alanine ligase family protein [Candidatus Saccharimonas sp.]|nr:D-alanine--D-alanine ligase family protein [Candidatus Saccharimonas sp.]
MQPLHSTKQRIGILFGGQSAEHNVSLQSARSVLAALNTSLFEPVLIKITRQGAWHLLQTIDGKVTPQNRLLVDVGAGTFYIADGERIQINVVFPVLHGPFGEDGTLQGLIKLTGLPCVGCDVLASAVGMDKDMTKRLLRDAGLPVANFKVAKSIAGCDVTRITKELGLPLFVKPANMGSSVGVSKVISAAEFLPALTLALQYDKKAIIETAIIGSEIECAVLGNDDPKVSVPGRIAFTDEFYTYDAKYNETLGTQLEIPAKLSPTIQKRAQDLALKAYQVLECRGLARVDMFVTQSGDVIINEINTMPGFTKFSMYPQLWQASGLSYTALITELIQLAQQ